MEHQNREFKAHLATVGGNIKHHCSHWKGSEDTISAVCDHFDNTLLLPQYTILRKTPPRMKEFLYMPWALNSKYSRGEGVTQL